MGMVKMIEKVREELVKMGMEKGFQDPQVIKQSQMLDEIINQYYRLESNSTEVEAAS